MPWAARSLLMAMLCVLATAGAAEEFSCSGPFGPDASHAGLVKAFGASNISYEEVFRRGDTMPMTVVYPHDPERRLTVHWRDSEGRRGVDFVSIQSPAWSVNGAAIGMSVAAVERANGGPFRLADFIGRDDDGSVSDWQGGKLEAALPGGCRLGAVLGINDPDAYAARWLPHAGNALTSDDDVLRAADPKLYELIVSFPKTDVPK